MLIEVNKKKLNIDLNDEHFGKIILKKDSGLRNAFYIEKIAKECFDLKIKNKLLNRANKIRNCMSIWWWDYYKKNKIMDLNKVWRCMDYYCPNCRTINLSIAINKFWKYLDIMFSVGLNPFFVTLTIPNVDLEDIYLKINMLNDAFYKVWCWLSYDNNRGLKDRLFDVRAAIKAIELTINKINSSAHLHIHSIMFIENYSYDDFDKMHEGYYRYKSNEIVMLSEADIFISKIWTMAVNEINKSQYKKLPDGWEDYFKCDIRQVDCMKGVYEVFKYSFKDTDIVDFDIFKAIFFGFRGHRLRQSYGKISQYDGDSDNDIQKVQVEIEDFLKFNETPQLIKTYDTKELVNEHKNIRKISRFKAYKEFINVKS